MKVAAIVSALTLLSGILGAQGSIEGTVTNSVTGEPIKKAMVTLGGVELSVGSPSTAMTDASGHFHFENVRPGDYKLFAWDDVEPNIWFDPECLKNFEDRGAPITLPVSGQATVQLRLLTSQ